MGRISTALPSNGISGPPQTFRQNETITWQDVPYSDRFFNQFDSNSYLLTYVFVGPSVPISIAAVPSTLGGVQGLSGSGWVTTLTKVQAALFLPGNYWWQAILTGLTSAFTGSITGTALTVLSGFTGTIVLGATVAGAGIPAGVTIISGSGNNWVVSQSLSIGSEAITTNLATRTVAFEGELTVEPDYAALLGTYDGRSSWQQILDAATTALLQFQASGGRVKAYNIAGRSMTFQDDKEIMAIENLARSRVEAEKQAASGGDRRNLRIGFSAPNSGVPTANSKNWPWW